MELPVLVENYDPSRHSGLLERVEELYVGSFPLEERRPWDKLLGLLSTEPNFTLSLILDAKDGSFAGFLTHWLLENINYGEHFAMDPRLRGRGWGRALLNVLWQEPCPRPFVFEVEPPTTPIAARRLAFYQSLGAKIISTSYLQPPYAAGQQGMPLYLMARGGREEDAEQYQRILYRYIYHVPDSLTPSGGSL